MKGQFERRFVPFTAFEVRKADDGPAELVGYAAVFDQESVISDWFMNWREVVAPGAFKKTLREGDIRALWNHDPNIVLGRNKAKTLELREDEHGLHTVIQPPDNEWGRPVLDAVRRGDVTGMSIGFQVVKEQIDRPEKGSTELPKRTIKEAKLFDVSPVTFPAFEQTDISARSELRFPLQDENADVLLRAAALVRCAQRGLVLTADEMRIISEAGDIFLSVSGEPGPARSEKESLWTGPHSAMAQGNEPGEPGVQDGAVLQAARSEQPDADHSEAARARTLQMMRLQMEVRQ